MKVVLEILHNILPYILNMDLHIKSISPAFSWGGISGLYCLKRFRAVLFNCSVASLALSWKRQWLNGWPSGKEIHKKAKTIQFDFIFGSQDPILHFGVYIFFRVNCWFISSLNLFTSIHYVQWTFFRDVDDWTNYWYE